MPTLSPPMQTSNQMRDSHDRDQAEATSPAESPNSQRDSPREDSAAGRVPNGSSMDQDGACTSPQGNSAANRDGESSRERRASTWARLTGDTWYLEAASLGLCLVCFAVICAILAVFDGKPAPKLPRNITLNAIVSFLASLSKGSLLMAVGAAISQNKWLWFRKTRELKDIQSLEDASRGPLGSLLLLFSLSGSFVTAIGAIVVIFSIGFEPFVQQLILYPLRGVPAQSDLAVLSVTIDDASGPLNFLGLPFYSAITSGIYDGNSSPRYRPACPHGSCIWPNYYSLAICSKCVDVLDQVSEDDKPGARLPIDSEAIINALIPNITQSRLNGPSLPVVTIHNRTFHFQKGVPASFLLEGSVLDNGPFDPTTGMTEIPAVVTLSPNYTVRVIWPLNVPDLSLLHLWGLLPPYWINDTFAGIKDPLVALGSISLEWSEDGSLVKVKEATECAMTLCVHEYRTRVNGTAIDSEILSTHYGAISASLAYTTWFVRINHTLFSISDGIESSQLSSMAETLFAATTGAGNVLTEITCLVRPGKPNKTDDVYNCDYAHEFTDTIWSSTPMEIIQSGSLSQTLDNIAASTTDLFHRYGTKQITGLSISTQNFVQVKWVWTTLPLTLIFLGFVTLLGTMLQTRKGRMAVWKSSLFPLLDRGPRSSSRPEAGPDINLETNAVSHMGHEASLIHAELLKRSTGVWWLDEISGQSFKKKDS